MAGFHAVFGECVQKPGNAGGPYDCRDGFLNKEAVAWRQTVQSQFMEVRKSRTQLKSFSKRYPVGCMIFGNADLIGLPWGTLIKIFRDEFGQRKFGNLEDYAYSFIALINEQVRDFFSENEQKAFLRRKVRSYFKHILEEKIKPRIEDLLDKRKRLEESKI